MLTSRKASEIPTAIASIEVPIATASSVQGEEARRALPSSPAEKLCIIMCVPTPASRTKAIQWS